MPTASFQGETEDNEEPLYLASAASNPETVPKSDCFQSMIVNSHCGDPRVAYCHAFPLDTGISGWFQAISVGERYD